MAWDAIGFLRDHGLQYWTEGNNVQDGWVNIRCPLCGDHSNHGGFNPYGDYYNCWRCGRSNLWWVVSHILSVPRDEAESIVFEYSGRATVIGKINRKEAKAKKIDLPGESLQRPHKRYLRGRGFNPRKLEQTYGLRGTGKIGEWKYRIIIPIVVNGVVVSYQGRDYTGKQKLRYKTLSVEKSVVDHREILYAVDLVPDHRQVGVVEGLPDQWRMGPGFVATFGTTLTEAQIRALGRFDRIVFLFDPETEAQKKALTVAHKLSSLGREVELIDLEEDRDPAELSQKEADAIRRELGFGIL